jgi:decaprenylphospho-beta-D-ribofuranose 2-oxidase
VLERDRIETIEAWGRNRQVASYVFRPSTVAGITEAFTEARKTGRYIGLRGAGRSYGDASQAAENLCLDLTRLNRILDWNPQSGVITVEPGVTVRQLWQHAIGDGWWPYVVSGTMTPTIGGIAGMNIHGKNNFKVGTVGDHLLAFDLLLPNGEIKTCSRTENPALFHAAIGGFGMLGVFTSLTLELKKVHSGLLKVEPIPVASWRELFALTEERIDQKNECDYWVGWVDAFATGKNAGRGQIHAAYYLKSGEDPAPRQTLQIGVQELPETLFGLVPKSILWRFLKPLTNNTGMRFLNAAKYHAGNIRSKTHLVSHAGFHFLLDYVPDWKRAYDPHGLIQYQSFIPKETAEAAFSEQIALCQKRGIIPYLAVFKRHRPDPFLMTHAVDGYSLALDFKISKSNRVDLWQLTADLDRILAEAGGRFYFAKDATVNPKNWEAYLSEPRVQEFLAIKQQCDPENLLQTDLYRRIFPQI